MGRTEGGSVRAGVGAAFLRNQSVPTASIRLRNAQTGELLEEAACGNGSFDAIFKAMDRITEEEVELVDCKIVSVTRGKDALGEVYVQLNQKGLPYRAGE